MQNSETPATVRDVLLLVLEADAYPILGNEDVPIALRMERAALQHATTLVSSPDDPPEFARWLEALRQLGIGQDECEEVFGAMYAYFDPEETPQAREAEDVANRLRCCNITQTTEISEIIQGESGIYFSILPNTK